MSERTARTPGNGASWRLYADILRQLGDLGSAQRAAERADALLAA